uniref:Protein GIGANTEA n=1 Tax=Solanum tuberosum TaxID=4113 RepID=M0ZKR6_SOLTU
MRTELSSSSSICDKGSTSQPSNFLEKSSIFSKNTSALRDFMYAGSVKPSVKEVEDVNGIHNPAYQYLSISIIDWKTDIGKCLMCEANNRLENGMSAQFLDTAARELGCTISV